MEMHALELATELVARGFETGLVFPKDAVFDDFAARATASHVAIWRIDTLSLLGRRNQVRALASYAKVVRTWRPDVVHVHTGTAGGGLGVLAATRLAFSAVLVLTEHDVPPEEPDARHVLSRALVDRLVDALVAVSRRNAALRIRRLSPRTSQFAVVLNGVSLPEADAASEVSDRLRVRVELAIPDGAYVVGCLVRLVEGKGLPVLIRAFAALQVPRDSRLLLVGEGPLRGELERLAGELGVLNRVVFAGHRAQPRAYLHAMDAFVLAVPAGSMSIALLEAMASRLPAVITFAGPEEPVISGYTGLAAPPDEPEMLARAIRELMDDPTRAGALAAAGAAHVRRNFSVGRVADDLLEVYQVRDTHRLPDRLRAQQPASILFEPAAALAE